MAARASAPAALPVEETTTPEIVGVPDLASDEIRIEHGGPQGARIECASGYIVMTGGTSDFAKAKMTGPLPYGYDKTRVLKGMAFLGLNESLFRVEKGEDGNDYLVNQMGEPLYYETVAHHERVHEFKKEERARLRGMSPLIQNVEDRQRSLSRLPHIHAPGPTTRTMK